MSPPFDDITNQRPKSYPDRVARADDGVAAEIESMVDALLPP